MFWGQFGFQDSATPISELLCLFHDYMMSILLFILVFVSYIFFYVGKVPLLDSYTLESHFLETIWTIFPMVVLLFMAFPSLYLLYLMEDFISPSLMVKVVGHQWYWEYQYSSSWFSFSFDSYMIHSLDSKPLFHTLDVDNRLILPTSSNILFLVTSADVLHSWTVPSLGVKTDAIPGRLNYLSVLVPFSGIFYGQCSEICGSNHSLMPIVVEFIPTSFYIDYLSSLN